MAHLVNGVPQQLYAMNNQFDIFAFPGYFLSKLTIGVVSMKQLRPEPSPLSDWLAVLLAILIKLVRYF
jgi:hypothetical protein